MSHVSIDDKNYVVYQTFRFLVNTDVVLMENLITLCWYWKKESIYINRTYTLSFGFRVRRKSLCKGTETKYRTVSYKRSHVKQKIKEIYEVLLFSLYRPSRVKICQELMFKNLIYKYNIARCYLILDVISLIKYSDYLCMPWFKLLTLELLDRFSQFIIWREF